MCCGGSLTTGGSITNGCGGGGANCSFAIGSSGVGTFCPGFRPRRFGSGSIILLFRVFDPFDFTVVAVLINVIFNSLNSMYYFVKDLIV